VVALVIDEASFELVDGSNVGAGRRRSCGSDHLAVLEGFADQYASLVAMRRMADGDLLVLGRELFSWLDGSDGALSSLLAGAPRPVVLEVRSPVGSTELGRALQRAPFELLASEAGFLAADGLMRFAVVRRLGSPIDPPQLDEYRLGLAFMASAPRGHLDLDFEAEESAILGAVRDADLWVEESGDPIQFADRLRRLTPALPVVHLSCHGLNTWRATRADEPQPVLAMEDEVGNLRVVTAPTLVQQLREPRMVFLSACLTARRADAEASGDRLADTSTSLVGDPSTLVANSMASALVSAGLPAIVGWDGSVHDRAATVFAGELYGRLAQGDDLSVAAADARRILLGSSDDVVHRDWHMARVWLGPTGGGPIASGTRARSLVPVTHGQKVFLDAKEQVPVASHELFVGRRREIQQALRVLRGNDHAGVLIHGMGRQGKSSLAARLISRSPEFTAVVVFEHYDSLSIVDAITESVSANRDARELLRSRRDELRDDPSQLEYVLIDLLTGPCQQETSVTKPLLLIIDDLERILDDSLHRPDGARLFRGTHG